MTDSLNEKETALSFLGFLPFEAEARLRREFEDTVLASKKTQPIIIRLRRSI
jgi:hypothetical protein